MAWSHKQILCFSFTEQHQDCLLECLRHFFFTLVCQATILGWFVFFFLVFEPPNKVCRQFTTLNKFPVPSKTSSNNYLLANTKHHCFFLYSSLSFVSMLLFILKATHDGHLWWYLFPSKINGKTSPEFSNIKVLYLAFLLMLNVSYTTLFNQLNAFILISITVPYY